MQKNMARKTDKKQLFLGVLFLLLLGAACLLTYKAQFQEKLGQDIEFTMMTEHKPTAQVTMSAENPILSEVLLCQVPKLKKISVYCTGEGVDEGASLRMTLENEETGKVYYRAEKPLTKVLGRAKNMVHMRVKAGKEETEGMKLRLTWELKDPGSTVLTLKANTKQGLVLAFCGAEEDKTNVVYTMYYGNTAFLKELYVILCAALLFFGAMCWYLLVCRRLLAERFYLPAALFLGLIFQGLITVYGVPDEPGHFDTAYKYSNKLLLLEDTGIPGTIYKRRCDVEMGDMLAYGLESNSYYQLFFHTLERPENTELVVVGSVDSTNLVPGIVYIPSAVGISIGRLLGLSAMLTMQIGRVFNLLAFVFLTWMAIRLTPVGKNLFAVFGMLPISLQQGASASYDAVVNGLLFLFFAFCLFMAEKETYRRRDAAFLVLLSVFLAVAKGGAYLPMLLFLLMIPSGRRRFWAKRKKKQKILLVLAAGAVLALLLILALIKFMPVLQSFWVDSEGEMGEEALYSASYLLRHPLKILYMYWNTLTRWFDSPLRGLMGGMLAWLDVKISWGYSVVMLVCILLLANTEADKVIKGKKERLLIGAACGLSTGIIMMSMLVGFTVRRLDYIQGIQGRYFIPFAPALFSLACCDMVRVQKRQAVYIWMTVLTTEILMVLQAAAVV